MTQGEFVRAEKAGSKPRNGGFLDTLGGIFSGEEKPKKQAGQKKKKRAFDKMKSKQDR